MVALLYKSIEILLVTLLVDLIQDVLKLNSDMYVYFEKSRRQHQSE